MKDYRQASHFYEKALPFMESHEFPVSSHFLRSDIYIGLGFAAYFQKRRPQEVLSYFNKAQQQDAPFPYFLKDFLKALYMQAPL
jgi:hypothetical protein